MQNSFTSQHGANDAQQPQLQYIPLQAIQVNQPVQQRLQQNLGQQVEYIPLQAIQANQSGQFIHFGDGQSLQANQSGPCPCFINGQNSLLQSFTSQYGANDAQRQQLIQQQIQVQSAYTTWLNQNQQLIQQQIQVQSAYTTWLNQHQQLMQFYTPNQPQIIRVVDAQPLPFYTPNQPQVIRVIDAQSQHGANDSQRQQVKQENHVIDLINTQNQQQTGVQQQERMQVQPIETESTFALCVTNRNQGSNLLEQQQTGEQYQGQMQFAQPKFRQLVDNQNQSSHSQAQSSKKTIFKLVKDKKQHRGQQQQPMPFAQPTFTQLVDNQNQSSHSQAQPQMQGQPAYAQWVNNQQQSQGSNPSEHQR